MEKLLQNKTCEEVQFKGAVFSSTCWTVWKMTCSVTLLNLNIYYFVISMQTVLELTRLQMKFILRHKEK